MYELGLVCFGAVGVVVVGFLAVLLDERLAHRRLLTTRHDDRQRRWGRWE